jgi:hypothetical protein
VPSFVKASRPRSAVVADTQQPFQKLVTVHPPKKTQNLTTRIARTRTHLPQAVQAASLTGQLLSLKHSSSARSRSGTWGETAALSTFSISSAMTAQAASRTAWLLALDWLT